MPAMDRPEVRLTRDLIRAFSPSGKESPAVAVLADACRDLGYDAVEVDAAGNLVATIRRGDGPTVMLNGHLDTVPLGEEAKWPYPPLSGAIEGGNLWGRGSSDMKSSVACMAIAGARAAESDVAGTILVTGVVQEEVGGLGARHLASQHHPDVVILGEPSGLQLMRGHRGRVELDVTLPGRIAHAAKSELGENALYRAAAFLERLQALELPAGGPLGSSTATPTRLVSYPEDGANVVPGSAVVTIDYRNLPDDAVDDIVARLQHLDPGAHVVIPTEDAQSETGEIAMTFPRVNDGYIVSEDDPWLAMARRALRPALARHDVGLTEGVWWFATDAPMLAVGGATVIGFGPGDPEVAHTTQECVAVERLGIATEAYADLVRAFLTGRGGDR